LFQSMTYHDTPAQPLSRMEYVDTSAKPGEKHTYGVVTVNSVGLKSKPSVVRTLSTTPAPAPQLPGVGAAIQAAIDAHEIAGAVTVVATNDKVLHLEATGRADIAAARPMQPDSVFWIASMTKPVTAVAVLMLQDEGKLNVTDPVAKYIPAFADLKTPSGKSANLTITQILTHTSGLGEAPVARARDAHALADLVPLWLAAPMQYEPGARWQYTQSGINLAARIVEVVSGQSFDAFVQQRILDPLVMKSTTFYPAAGSVVTAYAKSPTTGQLEPAPPRPDFGVRGHPPLGNGGLYSTGPDYARFCQMLLGGGVLDGKRYLSPESVKLLTTVQTGDLPCGFFQSATFGNHGANYGWGIGTCILRTPHEGGAAMLSPGTFGHGGAWGTQAWMDPARGVAYVLMVQRSNFPNSDASNIRRAFQQAAADALTRTAGPDFGPNVLVFDPAMATIQEQIDTVFAKQERNQFGSERYAYLFKPGTYNLDVQVGFYMHVLGLGRSPDDVAITGAVRSKANWMARHNATCNFWRTVENVCVTPTQDNNVNICAVSQGTAMRRTHIKGALNLWDGGWSSGGFLADCKIDERVNSGSQQQWLSRNDEWGQWVGGVWNMVFVGTVNPPSGSWPAAPYTVIEKTPVIREKPYLFLDENGSYFLMVPALQTEGAQGITWAGGTAGGDALPLGSFYLAHPGVDTAASLNTALGQGKHLLLTPGIYPLESSIRVTRPGTVVLGLGYPTLVPDKGTPAVEIADVDGVKVGGLLLEAAAMNSHTLLQVGEPGCTQSHATDPTFLYDIYCRAGGPAVGLCDCLVTIHSNDVVGDNLWLWRADHGRGVGWTSNQNHTGLIVNGSNVTLYGLFVEHAQEYQTIWNGNGGRVYFYQSEMPYDPPGQEAWRHDTVNGFASYKVTDHVTTHEAWGLGVYCVFNRAAVVADDAIETPTTPGAKMHHMVTIRLGGRAGSGINHVINDAGDPVITRQKAIVD
jgi:CubicO group peptidase (beta-lactamase class C family)